MDAANSTATTVELTAEQSAYIDGLRDLADFLTHHPEFINGAHEAYGMSFAMTRDVFIARARKLGAERWEQLVTDRYFKLIRRFGPHQVYIYADRESICDPVETSVTEWRAPADLFADRPVDLKLAGERS